MLDRATVDRLFPSAPAAHRAAFAARAGSLLTAHGIADRPQRIAMFLAQIGHESAGLTALEERLSYTAPRLMQVWPGRFPTLAAARPYAASPRLLANLVYANRIGNGPPATGDGWRYRGRGYIQLTGRANYRAVGAACGIDLEGAPDRAAAPADALAVACGFWTRARLNPLADTGDIAAVTARINGGAEGLAQRRQWLARVTAILGAPARPPSDGTPSPPPRQG